MQEVALSPSRVVTASPVWGPVGRDPHEQLVSGTARCGSYALAMDAGVDLSRYWGRRHDWGFLATLPLSLARRLGYRSIITKRISAQLAAERARRVHQSERCGGISLGLSMRWTRRRPVTQLHALRPCDGPLESLRSCRRLFFPVREARRFARTFRYARVFGVRDAGGFVGEARSKTGPGQIARFAGARP